MPLEDLLRSLGQSLVNDPLEEVVRLVPHILQAQDRALIVRRYVQQVQRVGQTTARLEAYDTRLMAAWQVIAHEGFRRLITMRGSLENNIQDLEEIAV